MKATRIVTLSAILAAVVNVAWATDGEYQPDADSTGGTSRVKGELPVTVVRTVVVTAVAHKAGKYQPSGDSTGGSSRARGELVQS